MLGERALRFGNGLLGPREDYQSVEHKVASVAFEHPSRGRWWLAMVAALGLLGVLGASLLTLFWKGVGVWGNNIPVTWALDIVSYDWWISLGTGGLFVSAALLLFGAPRRGAVNRLAETIAVLAGCAGAIYPIIHLGRPWFFYWNLPYPNSMKLWPQFRSPLYWDAVDIVSYLGVSVLFWYVGLLPDLASLRDAAISRARREAAEAPRKARLEAPPMHGMAQVRAHDALRRAQFYGIAALGWRGSAVHWQRWTQAYRTIGLFGLITVVALQTGAAVMYAGTAEPGWHDTMLPTEFLTSAVFEGVAGVTLFTVLIRAVFRLEALITTRHLELLGWLLLALGIADLYCHAAGMFVTALGGDPFEAQLTARRMHGAHRWAFWCVIGLSLIPVHLFWIRGARRSPLLLFGVGLTVTGGIWCDHFMTIVVTLQHDFLPAVAQPYRIGIWGVATYAGSAGLFGFLLLLAARYLPIVSILDSRRLTRPAAHTPPAVHPDTSLRDAPLWAVSAEFESADAVTRAIGILRDRGFKRLDAFSPVPLAGAPEALRLRRQSLRPFAVVGLVLGAAAMFGMCTYATVYDYSFNIGGRPRFSWPYFVVPTASFSMLTATLAVVFGLLHLNRLPRLNHPAFNIPGFEAATDNRFFLVVEARHEAFDPEAVERALAALPTPPARIARVPR